MPHAGLKKMLGGLVDVRRQELSRVLPLTLAYGLIMASLYVLKPARNALFLDRLGVAQLPYVLLLVALVGGGVAVLFSRLTQRIRLDRLILGTFLFLMINLLGFRLLLTQGWGWSFYLFYVWVSLYGLLATSLLWLLANLVFNPREARRLFGLIGSAGIAGAILGGAFTGWVAQYVGTENLLLVCVGLIGACLLLLYRVRASGSAPAPRKGKGDGPLAAIAGSDLLRLLGGIAALAAVVAAIIDVQFNDIVDRAFADKDAKTAFFGQFFALLNAFAFLFQMLGTPRILRSIGVVSALFFLPLSMGIGSLAVLFAPGLAAAVLLKGGDLGFRHSLHKSAMEILFLPVPTEVKQRTKVLLDTTVDNLATGLGALLVLALTAWGVSYQHLGLLSLGLIVLWVTLIIRGRGVYTDTFRQALYRREIDPGTLTMDITEAAALNSLIASLDSRNERQVVYALDMLATVPLVEPVRRLLGHPAAAVRQRAIRVLGNQEGAEVPAELEALLLDADLEVRVEALYYLCRQEEDGPRRRLGEALQSADPRLRSAAVGCIAKYGTEAGELVDESFIEELVQEDGPQGKDSRLQAARIIGAVGRPAWRSFLRQLTEDPDPEVVEQAISSLGQIGDPEHLPYLIEKLGDRRQRRAARQALATYGKNALGALETWLRDEKADLTIRRGITRVLSDVQEQAAVDLLLDNLDRVEPQVEYLLIKSLSRQRARKAELNFELRRIEAALDRKIESYYRILQVRQFYREREGGAAWKLLRKVLLEKQEQLLESIFRLLGLQHAPRDMYHAYLGLVGGRPQLRASALEFLDNVLPRPLKERLLPLLDSPTPEEAMTHGERLFGGRLGNRGQALDWLLEHPDGWLRACAAYSAVEEDEVARLERIHPLRRDPDVRVREAAEKALRRLDSAGLT